MDRLQTLQQVFATHMTDGMVIDLGCGLESLIPSPPAMRLFGRREKSLTLIGPIYDIQFDQLIGAGAVL